MADRSAIEWTDASWNPFRGVKGNWHCTKVSPGCQYCYAERLNLRFGGPAYKVGADTLRLEEALLDQPLRWRRPRRVFVCSMTDLFHEDVPDAWLEQVFAVMALGSHHQFQVLTKRAERMRRFLSVESAKPLSQCPEARIGRLASDIAVQRGENVNAPWWDAWWTWPLPHIWLGVSAEDQKRFDERWPALAQTPAAVRFLSLEPLLGPIDLRPCLGLARDRYEADAYSIYGSPHGGKISWVIVGGESGGPPERAMVNDFKSSHVWDRGRVKYRPKYEALEWVRSLRDQCAAAGVPFFFKQWGGATSKSGGRLLDGRTWDEYPP